jgi:3-oxoacyl-[acyl-carrier-protein] synthase-3
VFLWFLQKHARSRQLDLFTFVAFKSTIIGTGSAFPQRVLTNKHLTEMVDTTEEWIVERTGVRERRISDLSKPHEQNSALGAKAALAALEMADIKPQDIDQIIYATCTSDTIIPSASCRLQMLLGMTNAWAVDVNAACCGFLSALTIADQAIRCGQSRHCLVIGSDLVSTITNWSDRGSCILFGDGAGAILVSQAKDEESHIFGSFLRSDGAAWEMLHIPGGGSRLPVRADNLNQPITKLHMKGQEVFKLAVNSITDVCRKILQQHAFEVQALDWVVVHQANYRILEAVARRLNISMDKVLVNVDRFGNTSSATIPSVLDEFLRAGKIKKGHLVLMSAFGGGAHWGATLLRW